MKRGRRRRSPKESPIFVEVAAGEWDRSTIVDDEQRDRLPSSPSTAPPHHHERVSGGTDMMTWTTTAQPLGLFVSLLAWLPFGFGIENVLIVRRPLFFFRMLGNFLLQTVDCYIFAYLYSRFSMWLDPHSSCASLQPETNRDILHHSCASLYCLLLY